MMLIKMSWYLSLLLRGSRFAEKIQGGGTDSKASRIMGRKGKE